ncbi:beta-1,4-galactosyltransferase 4-like [Tubulanus polymorphus]|uniref:beta-1,4-galactosyltransferase 4-like n=1 Tax=Tubulanus polymorphus TaxID=672921 RepID=UPI003DA35556
MIRVCHRKIVERVVWLIFVFTILNIAYSYLRSVSRTRRSTNTVAGLSNDALKFIARGDSSEGPQRTDSSLERGKNDFEHVMKQQRTADFIKQGIETTNKNRLEACKGPDPNELGTVNVETDLSKIPDYETMFPMVKNGGWTPSNCTPTTSFAMLVPYRNRPDNLKKFIYHMHKFLLAQKNEYKIFLIEQADMELFNRAKLLNIGYLESQKFTNTGCYIVHDLDKLPENTRHIYKCAGPTLAQHMMGKRREQQNKKYSNGILYSFYVGGVLSIPRQVFRKVNGFSNRYWGWGREDDDFSARIRAKNLKVSFLNGQRIASYLILSHIDDRTENKMKWPFINEVKKVMDKDGLNDAKYKVISIKDERLFIRISVDLMKNASAV